ncbi:hypothetical protein AB9K35_16480 [Leisingera sp. XS_AS12]|uniref:hypothetical protein n=1 Tax=Leisingera sp. XS_AS12 TaxID=3241294 RepID=UPI0035144930
MEQILKELTLIASVAAVTLVAYLAIRKSQEPGAGSFNRLLTGLLGAFLLLGGTAKFFMPFTHMFEQQIALSNLPFPRLAAVAGQGGEIAAGLMLVGFFSAWPRLHGRMSEQVFVLANFLTGIIMLVAVYVHLHPSVPAEVLPFQSKPPVVTVIILGLTALNVRLRRQSLLI